MYLLENMLDKALEKCDQKWKSEDHKVVAVNICIGNSRINTMDQLMECVSIINKIPKNKIKVVTVNELQNDYKFMFMD